jgi:hypothetical protein
MSLVSSHTSCLVLVMRSVLALILIVRVLDFGIPFLMALTMLQSAVTTVLFYLTFRQNHFVSLD